MKRSSSHTKTLASRQAAVMASVGTFLASFYQVAEIYSVCLLLHKVSVVLVPLVQSELELLIPVALSPGYCCDFNGRRLDYRLNGLKAYVGLKDPTFLSNNFANCWISGALLGSIATAFFHVRGLHRPPPDRHYSRCITTDMVASPAPKPSTSTAQPEAPELIRSPVPVNGRPAWYVEVWNGLEFNPRVLGDVDVKMMLYMWGAVLLELNLGSMMWTAWRANGGAWTAAMAAYGFMLTWFVTEYMYFENVHLYTYDLFAEKIGFKLLFGCLGFYPFAYALGGTVLSTYAPYASITVDTNMTSSTDAAPTLPDLSSLSVWLTLALFITGWILTRGPNMQKYYFKMDPRRPTCFAGFCPQRTVPGTRIIVSGFWGVSRHVNYFGEIIQAVALAIPGYLVTGSLIPWIYPLYYLALFIPRERDDHEICRRKYGRDWDEYCRLVPYRIVPFVY
ncbi:hypothetical protein HK101_011251 [Irineochytrium annulatum]|nr:hypothetical protein HK101_011251 [Irineochytrium annulatum]